MNLQSDALTFCLNFNGTDNWLAARSTRQMIQETGYPVCCIPYVASLGNVARDSSRIDDPLAAYKARRSRARRMFAERELERNCQMLGIPVEQGSQEADGGMAARGLLTLVDSGAAEDDCWSYIERVFAAHFLDGVDITDEAVIDGFLGGALNKTDDDLQATQVMLEDAGIFNSPAYLFNGERFHGRQHLPLIRWQIEGSVGVPPV